MAIKLLGHVFWSAATATAADRRSDWVVELREPSRWNPSAPSDAVTPKPGESSAGEPVWAETQPSWYD